MDKTHRETPMKTTKYTSDSIVTSHGVRGIVRNIPDYCNAYTVDGTIKPTVVRGPRVFVALFAPSKDRDTLHEFFSLNPEAERVVVGELVGYWIPQNKCVHCGHEEKKNG